MKLCFISENFNGDVDDRIIHEIYQNYTCKKYQKNYSLP